MLFWGFNKVSPWVVPGIAYSGGVIERTGDKCTPVEVLFLSGICTSFRGEPECRHSQAVHSARLGSANPIDPDLDQIDATNATTSSRPWKLREYSQNDRSAYLRNHTPCWLRETAVMGKGAGHQIAVGRGPRGMRAACKTFRLVPRDRCYRQKGSGQQTVVEGPKRIGLVALQRTDQKAVGRTGMDGFGKGSECRHS